MLPLKRGRPTKATGPKSTYQATKAKAHKARGHKGANSRQRQTSTANSGRRRKK